MGHALRALLAACALLTWSVSAQAPLDVRVALVIGNSAYPDSPLLNPANDARAMSTTLRSLGFSVIELRDAQKAQMAEAIDKVRETLKGKQGVGMLYYAGHGLQQDWHNYMVPLDARLAKAADVPVQTVDINLVIDAFKQAGNRMNIIVLDACRDNPFAGTATGKGLAPVDAPTGTFLAYATAPGNVAEDGEADNGKGNGLYTRHLLQELGKPVAKIEDVFKRVRLRVRQDSQGRQIPWESTSLEEDFYFNDGKLKTATQPAGTDKEQLLAQEKADWDRVRESTRASDLFAFLEKHPSGYLSEQAQFRLDQLQKTALTSQTTRDGVTTLPSGSRRFAQGDEVTFELTDRTTGNSRRVRARCTFADDQRAEFDNGAVIFDQMGGLIKNRFGTKDPAVVGAPADIALGKKWRSAFVNLRPDGVKETGFFDNKVVALEDIRALGRVVKAYRIEQTGEKTANGVQFDMRTTNWVDPASMRMVRSEWVYRRNGQVIENVSQVTLDYRKAGS